MKSLKHFIPRREMRSISSRGPIETLSIYCCLSKRILHFQKPIGFLKIFEPRKCFIPRREIRSISSRGPIEVSFHLLNFGLERVYWTSKTYKVYRVFFARKCFITRRWVQKRTPTGSQFEIFLFYISLGNFFLISKSHYWGGIF